MTIKKIAADYIARGWAPVPIPFKGKGPTIEGWQKLLITKENIDKYFNGSDQNIGVILGGASGGLADVDLDCLEAIALAARLLPATGGIFGRQSKPKSHYLYAVTDPDAKAAYRLQDPDDGTIVELRLGGRGGAQTVFPGSVHASGEKIEWVHDGQLMRLGCAELKRAVTEVGVGALLMRTWPAKGWHEGGLRLGGFLARVGWEPDKIALFTEIVLEQLGNDEKGLCATAAYDAAVAYQRDGRGYGLTALAEFIGENNAARICRFLEYKDTQNEDNLDKLNNRFCILPVSGRAKILEFKKNGERAETVFYSAADFRLLMDNQKIKVIARDKEGNEINKSVGLGSWWLNHPKRRQYEGMIFDPGAEGTVNDRLNLWQGWGIEPEAGSWALMRTHIRDVLAGGVTEFDDYIMKWVAWTFQHPGEPAEVVLVFRGGRGTGKGVFAREVKKAFGQHGMHISSAGQLAGRFNAHLMDCALLFADEAFWPGDKASEGTLKRMITEDVLFIERKGVDGFEVNNNLHIIMASNVEWVVPAGMDERRFAVFNVSEERKQNEEYFGPLYAEIEAGGTAAMMYDLLGIELSDWHPRRGVPKNDALRDQQAQSLSAADQWWFDRLNAGELPGSVIDNENKRISPHPDKVQIHPARIAISEVLFEHVKETVPGMRFSSYHLIGRMIRKHGAARDRDWRIDGRRAWLFPSLAEARAAWGNCEWENPELVEWNFYSEERF